MRGMRPPEPRPVAFAIGAMGWLLDPDGGNAGLPFSFGEKVARSAG